MLEDEKAVLDELERGDENPAEDAVEQDGLLRGSWALLWVAWVLRSRR
jgi:hypothetical protein